jgi:hypothetical protein
MLKGLPRFWSAAGLFIASPTDGRGCVAAVDLPAFPGSRLERRRTNFVEPTERGKGMTPDQKRQRALRIREVASWFERGVARTMLELAVNLEAEADAEEAGREPPPGGIIHVHLPNS